MSKEFLDKLANDAYVQIKAKFNSACEAAVKAIQKEGEERYGAADLLALKDHCDLVTFELDNDVSKGVFERRGFMMVDTITQEPLMNLVAEAGITIAGEGEIQVFGKSFSVDEFIKVESKVGEADAEKNNVH
ncbi:hypothetical protein 031MP004_38 [Bacillus phage 031MP004]|nr:hypothetical protein 031MP004_38 [Bacillus phage 031MP004]